MRKYNSQSIRIHNEDFKWIEKHRTDGETNGSVVARLIRNYDEARQLQFEKDNQDYHRCFTDLVDKRLKEQDPALFNMLNDKQKKMLETLYQESALS